MMLKKTILNGIWCLMGVALLSACGKKQNELMACDAPQHIEFISNNTKKILLNMSKNITADDFKVAISNTQKISAFNDKQGKEIQCLTTTEITFSGSLNGMETKRYEIIYHLFENEGTVKVEFENDKRAYLSNAVFDYLNKNNGLMYHDGHEPKFQDVKVPMSSDVLRKSDASDNYPIAAPYQQPRKIVVQAASSLQENRLISGERELQPVQTIRKSRENNAGERELQPISKRRIE